jgi:hypothetical protein
MRADDRADALSRYFQERRAVSALDDSVTGLWFGVTIQAVVH